MAPLSHREVALCSQRPLPSEPWCGLQVFRLGQAGQGVGHPESCPGWSHHGPDPGCVLELSRPSQPPGHWATVLSVWSGLPHLTGEQIAMELTSRPAGPCFGRRTQGATGSSTPGSPGPLWRQLCVVGATVAGPRHPPSGSSGVVRGAASSSVSSSTALEFPWVLFSI